VVDVEPAVFGGGAVFLGIGGAVGGGAAGNEVGGRRGGCGRGGFVAGGFAGCGDVLEFDGAAVFVVVGGRTLNAELSTLNFSPGLSVE